MKKADRAVRLSFPSAGRSGQALDDEVRRSLKTMLAGRRIVGRRLARAGGAEAGAGRTVAGLRQHEQLPLSEPKQALHPDRQAIQDRIRPSP